MRLVYGHGTNDVAEPTEIRIGGKQIKCPFYQTWMNILKRTYSPYHHKLFPTYIGTAVCDEWLRFSVFRAWMEEQNWEGKHLDKDILVPGNKTYAPDLCLFVSHRINTLLLDNGSSRGAYPIGVYRYKNKYIAGCRVYGKQKYLGSFDSSEEASLVYRQFKSAHVRAVADEQTEPLRSALHRHADIIHVGPHTMNEIRIKELEIELEELRKKVDGYEYSYWAMYDKNPHLVPFNWCHTELNLLQYPVEVEESGQGFIVTTPAKRKFVVTPNQRWRNLRKSKWYRYKTIDHLMKNYLLKND
jgi:hypothetical protein